MTHHFADITFTDGVKAVQTEYGSRGNNSRLQIKAGPNDRLGPRETEFISLRDSFYLATVSETDWPYVQYRGGPIGFLKVIDSNSLVYGDFRGNTQLVSVGNTSTNNRCSLILMDYPNRQRLKLLGHIEFIDVAEARQDLIDRAISPNYRGKIERIAIITVVAFDWNCPQHITPRFTEVEAEILAA